MNEKTPIQIILVGRSLSKRAIAAKKNVISMKRFFIILFCLLVANSLSALDWYGGRLIAGKDSLPFWSQPLISVFTERNITKEILWGAELAKNLGCFDDGCYMSCAPLWKLEKNKLYLEEITPCCGGFNSTAGHVPKVDLKKIFPDQFHHNHVFADWVNEEIVVGKGRCLFASIDYPIIFASEIGFIFKNGILQNTAEYDNSRTKTSPYREHESLLVDFIQSNIRWKEIKSEIDSTRRIVFCTIVSNDESGKIDSVSIYSKQSELLNNEAIRVIKSIPQWEVLFKKGKQIHRRWTLPVRFDIQTMNKCNQ